MGATVEKRICLAEDQARRLEQLAREGGVTESDVLEEALELLFSERPNSAESATGPRISPEETTFVVGTLLAPERILPTGERG